MDSKRTNSSNSIGNRGNQVDIPRRSKTGNGCITCKRRKIKCDEAKPRCTRCTKARLLCDGYAVPRSNSTFSIFANDRESRSYDYFRDCVVGKFVGPLNAPFWKGMVLRLVHSSHEVKHAVVSFGSLFEAINLASAAAAQKSLNHSVPDVSLARKLAFEQANAAIKLLREKGDSISLEIMLVVCIILMSIEMLLGEWASALRHFDSGVYIAKQWKNRSPAALKAMSPNDVERYILPVFSRFEIQFRPIRENYSSLSAKPRRHLRRDRLVCSDTEISHTALPVGFSNLLDASQVFENIIDNFINNCSAQGGTKNHDIFIHQNLVLTYMPLLQQWLRLFETYLARGCERDVQGYQTDVASLHVRYYSAKIFFSTMCFENETVFDSYNDDFEAINNWCLKFIQARKDSPFVTFRMIFDLCIIFPLRNNASFCRDPTIRRRALELLRLYDHSEGLWDSKLTADMTEYIIQIEEGRLQRREKLPKSCSDISEDQRIRLLSRTLIIQSPPSATKTSDATSVSVLEYIPSPHGWSTEYVRKAYIYHGVPHSQALVSEINGLRERIEPYHQTKTALYTQVLPCGCKTRLFPIVHSLFR